jgi:Berberine and berberine like
LAAVFFFYDAPTPSGVFDEFLAIPAIGGNLSTSSFYDCVQSLGPPNDYHSLRLVVHAAVLEHGLTWHISVFFNDAPVTQYSATVFDAFVNQTKVKSLSIALDRIVNVSQFWGERLYAQDNNVTLTSTFETFDKGLFSHGGDSAFPPDRSQAVFPSALTVEWSNSSLDDAMTFALRSFADAIHDVTVADGHNMTHAAKYPNYAIFGTPLEDMYGGNVKRLRSIRAAVDPNDVMKLTGGWKF